MALLRLTKRPSIHGPGYKKQVGLGRRARAVAKSLFASLITGKRKVGEE